MPGPWVWDGIFGVGLGGWVGWVGWMLVGDGCWVFVNFCVFWFLVFLVGDGWVCCL